MSNVHQQLARIKSGRPTGQIQPMGNGNIGRDELGRVFYISSAEQVEAIRRRRQHGKDTRKFSFTNMRNIREITEGLSSKYCGYILLLQPHIQYETNVLIADDSSGRPVTIDDLAKIWNVSKRTARTVMGELEARSIVFDHGCRFEISDRYHFRKKASDDVDMLIKTFFTALKRFKMSAADFGFVYKLLPYVHYSTNVICSDPFAENPEDIRFLNERQIAAIVGMAESKTKETLARLRKAGIVGEWRKGTDKRETLTVLNPYVFYRKNGQPDETLRALFEAHSY
ncbi:hypothetical protein G3578_10005 [Brevibacillus sp. SYP-B805]|uniref:hypothetical protein n=1 Tax=Brevibacillus sp. SYP-B805 TaxID=1578199 RepID=UPI0013EDE5A7|nr:hypothetical protein [Brevibacillus sp. SYP-B805]NGQ95485.1 hypothetical protein [Brevibacillus sp. SYP-B805]